MLFKEIFGPIAQRVDALRPELDALALDLHAHPELSFEEVRSSKEVAEFLRRRGFAVEPVADVPTAFRAARSFGGDRPRVVFMAEYDALPGVGHACGHNLIAGASVGGAAALADWMEAGGVSGEVVCLGTPAEE
ncbi:MAG: hypothetical protein K8I02_00235, partial [Candidatus Methylomirabilis sp.]|nr:hypothetical protein [Deltaproteobacteria bacterium]